MTSTATYLWCIYSLFLLLINQSNAQAATENLCLWGCRDPTTCMNMNGVFYLIDSSQQTIGGFQYYKQDDRQFEQCTQVYYIFFRSTLNSIGWFIGFSDNGLFDYADSNLIGRCLIVKQSAYSSPDPSTCDVWEFFNGNTGDWEVNSDVTVYSGDCPQAACAALNVDVDAALADPRLYACESDQFGETIPQVAPYPNMFWFDRSGIATSDANLVFNYKAWRWACYGNFASVNTAEGAVLPRCGGEASGVTAYSSSYEDFDGLSDGESIVVNMNLWSGTAFTTTGDVTITCVGDPTIDITLSPTTPVPVGATPFTYQTLEPVTARPTVDGETRDPTTAQPTPLTTRFPTPPTIDCDKFDCSGNSGSGSDDDDGCTKWGSLCWWIVLIIIIICVCCCCILCILLYKCCQKRKENKANETEMFGTADDTGSGNAGGADTGSYQPENNYGGNYNNNTQPQAQPQNNYGNNDVPPPPSSNQGYNQNPNYGNNNQWGGNQNYNQNPNQYNQNQYGNQQYGNNQYGNNQYGNNQGQWGGNQTYTQD